MTHKGPIFSLVILVVACWAATKAQAATYTLTVTADNGFVEINPEKAQYEEGETVVLMPRPEAGYSFSHWSGDLRGKRLVDRVTMNSNKSIAANFHTWSPPIGIPTPEFGIFETYRMYDDPANRHPDLTYHESPSGGYYTHYLDNTNPNATDLNNEYGTLAKPRMTIPVPLPAGSVVEVHGGPYYYNSGSESIRISGTGTPVHPIFIRGQGTPVFWRPEDSLLKFYITSSYLVIENVKFERVPVRFYRGDIYSDHVALRQTEHYGMGGAALATEAGNSNIVVYGTSVHDSGNWQIYDLDYDCHGAKIVGHDITIVDSLFYHLSGDGVQIGGGDGKVGEELGLAAVNVFVGRCIAYQNSQVNLMTKTARNVVFSQNTVWGSWDSEVQHTDLGGPFGDNLYATFRSNSVWFIYNTVYEGDRGIRHDSTLGPVYTIGNLVFDVTRAIGRADHIYHNTVFNATDVAISPNGAQAHNLTANPDDADLDEVFRNTSQRDFHLTAESAAIDGATVQQEISDVFDLYESTFGESIRYDIEGRARPQGATWDIGAYEYTLEAIEDLAVSGASRNSLTLGWTIPGADGSSDRPGRYDIRYAQLPLTEANWDAATQVQGELAPGDVGDSQSFTVTGLESGTTYYLAIKSSNTSESTVSSLSSVVSLATAASGNYAPVFAPVEDKTVAENTPLSVTVNATDADGDTLSYSAADLPTGATFNAATRTFSWTPTNTQGGTYWVTFAVTDGQIPISATVAITVAETIDNPPVLAAVGNKSVNENTLLSFSVSASDSDGDSLAYSATGLPTGANFTGQTFTWVPTYDQAGSYSVTFIVSDGELTDSEQVTITVANVTADLTDPSATADYPAANAIQAPVNPVVSVSVSDAGRGIDANTVTIRVNDLLVYSGNTTQYQSLYGTCFRTGTQANYRYHYQPAEAFSFDEQVSVRVTASDLAGNAMTPYTYSFTTEMRVFGDNHPASWVPDDLDKSGPATIRDSEGHIWLAYHAGPAGQRDIHVSRLTLGNANFAGSVQLTTNGSDQSHPAIAVGTDDRLYVVWQDNRRGNWDIYFRTSADGVTWSTETRITDSDNNQSRPAIAVDGQSPNRVCVAWQDDTAGNQDIYVATSSDAFSAKTISQVTANASDQTAPKIATDASNTVFVVWTDSRNGAADVYGAASDAGPWTNVAIATGAGDQSSPCIATEAVGTTLHLVWADNASGDSDIRYAHSDGLPGSPLAGVNVVDDTSAADQTAPSIAATGSAGDDLRVFVCWVDDRNVNTSGGDTDLYFVDASAGQGTNVLVGDGGTGSNQSEPAVGVDVYGHPYVLWTDNRNTTDYVYYAGSTVMAPSLVASELVTASTGRTVGVATPTSEDDVSAVIPAGACPHDVTITIARVLNPQSILASHVVAYDFGPSGIQFSQPVTLTIPYAAADYSGGPPVPCWYVSETGTLSQQGITNIQILDLSSSLKALRFRTTHFTPYYLLESFVDDGGDDGDGDGSWDGDSSSSGGGGGGCSLAPSNEGSILGFLLPYAALAAYMLVLRRKDRRRTLS